jgi:hypothetical protein
MAEATHYYLHSAMQIGDKVQMAGSIVTAEDFNTLADTTREMLLRDEHAEPCSPPAAAAANPFPRKPAKKAA